MKKILLLSIIPLIFCIYSCCSTKKINTKKYDGTTVKFSDEINSKKKKFLLNKYKDHDIRRLLSKNIIIGDSKGLLLDVMGEPNKIRRMKDVEVYIYKNVSLGLGVITKFSEIKYSLVNGYVTSIEKKY